MNYRQTERSLQATNDKTPGAWHDAYRELKKELERRGLYAGLRVGYLNACIRALKYNLNALTTWEAFCEVYEMLRSGGMEELGLKDIAPEEIDERNRKDYEMMQKIDVLPPERFLWEKRMQNAEMYRAEARRVSGSLSYRLGLGLTWMPRRIVHLMQDSDRMRRTFVHHG